MKVFISQPMAGRSDEEIIEERKMVKDYLDHSLVAVYEGRDEVALIDSFFKGTEDPPLMCLGKALCLMAGADLAVFAPGWEKAKGCVIEHDCCRVYGINHLHAEDTL
jgi:hypothetical protein